MNEDYYNYILKTKRHEIHTINQVKVENLSMCSYLIFKWKQEFPQIPFGLDNEV